MRRRGEGTRPRAPARRRLKQLDLLPDDEALAAQTLDLDGNELAELEQLLAQLVSSRHVRPTRVRLRGAEIAEGVSGADAEQAVGSIP